MKLLILIPAFFVFLYTFYKLIKDDYVFMRKNISSEQAFDIAFWVVLVSIFFSRFLFFIFNPQAGDNIIVSFFSAREGFSFVGTVIGGIVALYLLCKYKKFPLGRFSDFITLSFLVSLPVGLLSQIIFIPKSQWVLYFISIGIYFIMALIFIKVFHKKLMKRSIKEGKMAITFLMLFSLTSLFSSFLSSFKNLVALINIENGILVGLFIFSIILLVRPSLRRSKINT